MNAGGVQVLHNDHVELCKNMAYPRWCYRDEESEALVGFHEYHISLHWDICTSAVCSGKQGYQSRCLWPRSCVATPCHSKSLCEERQTKVWVVLYGKYFPCFNWHFSGSGSSAWSLYIMFGRRETDSTRMPWLQSPELVEECLVFSVSQGSPGWILFPGRSFYSVV